MRSFDLRREWDRKSLNFLALLRNDLSVKIFTQIYAIFYKSNLWKRTDSLGDHSFNGIYYMYV